MERMEACWASRDDVACLHPGGPWQRGWEEVREGWEAIMANTGYIEFEIADAAVSLVDPVAWVTCTERITSAGAGGDARGRRGRRHQPVRARRLRLAHRAAPRLAGHPARPRSSRRSPRRAVAPASWRRLPAFAALAAGALGAILALVGCVIAAAAGSGPSPGVALAIVIGVGAGHRAARALPHLAGLVARARPGRGAGASPASPGGARGGPARPRPCSRGSRRPSSRRPRGPPRSRPG